ncbi:ParB-like nuclease domain-containing protein [Salmonella enterica subsp. enterica]|uniref:ParB-like nuclease domain-containing protein n=1 Tax=Salmonella enterica I TaxID=59201 RepID=A0A615R371_SALET|nr:ParB-like nuclease domain-containing protein [Salmonella enterica subsp. enterica serovar Kingabwa]
MGPDMKTELEENLKSIENLLRGMSEEELLSTLNNIRSRLHELSPFRDEPVDCVLWIKASKLKANEYNPNVMAPTEQRLLYTSLLTEGYTQPVVATKGLRSFTVVDGYHRMQQGKHKPVLRERLKGYLPVVVLHHESDEGERRAATVRHNRARGQHAVAAMSELVRDLSRLGWSDERTAKELGMDKDEVLRLKQISGLAEMFSDETFSEAWTVE